MGENEYNQLDELEDIKDVLKLYDLENQYVAREEFSVEEILTEYQKQKENGEEKVKFEKEPVIITKQEEPLPQEQDVADEPKIDSGMQETEEPLNELDGSQYEKVDFSSDLERLYEEEPEEEIGFLGRILHAFSFKRNSVLPKEDDDDVYEDGDIMPHTDDFLIETDEEAFLDEPDDYEFLINEFARQKKNHTLRFTIGLCAEILLLFITIGLNLGFVTFSEIDRLPIILSFVLFGIVIAVCYKEVANGFLTLVKLEMGYESLCFFSVVICLFHGLSQIDAKNEQFVFYGAVVGLNILSLVFIKAKKAKLNFNNILNLSEGNAIEQLCLVEDKQITDGLLKSYNAQDQMDWEPCVVRRVKKDSTYNSLQLIQQDDRNTQNAKKISPILFVSTIVATGLVIFFTKEYQKTLTILSVFSIISTPFIVFFGSLLPAQWAKKKVPESIIISNRASEAFLDCDGMIFTDKDLFAKGKTFLNRILIYGECQIDMIIRDTASVLSAYDMAIAEVFLKILKTDKSSVFDVEPIGSFAGEGVHAISNGRKITIGTFDFMCKCGIINVSVKDTSKKQSKTKNTKNLFVAQDGVLACAFSIVYTIDPNLKAELKELDRNGVHIILNTFDPNVTPLFLSSQFDLSQQSILNVETPALPGNILTQSSSGVYTMEGGLFSFVKTIDACHKIKSKESVNIIAGTLSSVVSVVLFLILMSLNAMDQISALNILLYFIACMIPVAVNQAI